MVKKRKAAKQIWIVAGYVLFAYEGPQALKVEVLARQLHKSKSSFYHYFASMDIFIEELLLYHLLQAKAIAKQERACSIIVPDLLQVLLSAKEDVLFSRRLRIHREEERYQRCYEQVNAFSEDAILEIWTEALGLQNNMTFARKFLAHTLDNFYLQVSAKDYSYDWLLVYFANIQSMMKTFKRNY